MKIHNVRLGRAANSSSTHSIVFLKPGVYASDDLHGGGNFGWEYFTAASAMAKRQYFSYILFHNLRETVGDGIAKIVTREVCGSAPDIEYGGVDHQSMFGLPMSWDRKAVDLEFAREFLRFLENDRVAILGGNDNDEQEHPLAQTGKEISTREYSQNMVCRRDPSGYWTLFNYKTGGKVRLSFDPEAPAPVRSTVPELVDVKISDYCPMGCSYCYMGSTTAGKHADTGYLSSLAYQLGTSRVFEVAIGGGEPTQCPHLGDFLGILRDRGVSVAFTTRMTDWLFDGRRDQYLGPDDHVAFSVDTARDFDRIVAYADKTGVGKHQLSFQYVVGVSKPWEFKELLRRSYDTCLPLTLLGYKTTGRGADFEPEDADTWIEDVVAGGHCMVRVDTALARKYEAQLKAAGADERFYTTQEGRFSCYIDAVAKTIAPSSYGDPSLARPFTPSPWDVQDGLAKAFAEAG